MSAACKRGAPQGALGQHHQRRGLASSTRPPVAARANGVTSIEQHLNDFGGLLIPGCYDAFSARLMASQGYKVRCFCKPLLLAFEALETRAGATTSQTAFLCSYELFTVRWKYRGRRSLQGAPRSEAAPRPFPSGRGQSDSTSAASHTHLTTPHDLKNCVLSMHAWRSTRRCHRCWCQQSGPCPQVDSAELTWELCKAQAPRGAWCLVGPNPPAASA